MATAFGVRAWQRGLRLTVIVCLTPLAVAAQSETVWRVIAPGGKTRCAFDTPFEFWVREGNPDRVFIYLQGGGACWSLDSCDPRRDIAFDRAIDSTDYRQRRDGIFDRSNAVNPFRDHTAIFVPYCTGDLHLGTRTTRYGAAPGDTGQSVTVHHVGYYNVSAVMDYLASRAPRPALVTVIGASAGGVASPFVASEVARRLPGAGVRQIADGAGAFRVARLRALLEQWAVDSLMDALGSPLVASGDIVVGMYKAAASRHAQIRFSQVGTTSDAVVGGWLTRFGDDPSRVSAYIAETYRELEEAGLCFTGYTLPGTQHTVLWRPDGLATLVSGVPLGERLGREVIQRPCQGSAGRAANGAVGGRTVRQSARDGGDAAFLFAYRAKADMDAAFAQGYRRHLDWHAAHGDSLAWLAWTVIDGPAIGTFVDGTFGIAFKAFDDRVDPKGDAEDGARNVTAFATPTARQTLRLRRDLSVATRLESARPAAIQKVVTLSVRPGTEASAEQTLRALVARKSTSVDYAVYERVSGGEQPGYVLIAQLDRWAELDDPKADPTHALVRALGSSIARAESEVWLYRPDLTYVPKK